MTTSAIGFLKTFVPEGVWVLSLSFYEGVAIHCENCRSGEQLIFKCENSTAGDIYICMPCYTAHQ